MSGVPGYLAELGVEEPSVAILYYDIPDYTTQYYTVIPILYTITKTILYYTVLFYLESLGVVEPPARVPEDARACPASYCGC